MGLGSGIRDPGSGKNLFRIPDPGVKKAPDPGSAILERTITSELALRDGYALIFGLLWEVGHGSGPSCTLKPITASNFQQGINKIIDQQARSFNHTTSVR